MKYTADTWFFLQLVKKHPKAIEVWKEIIEGKGRMIVSTVVIAETVKNFLMKNLNKELKTIMDNLRSSEKVSVVEVTKEIAEEGGKYAYSYNMPTIDGIILETAILMEHTNILSIDEHYIKAEKQGKIKRVCW